jgi:dihydrofolate synthase / folylpolyglutamate synthase
VSQTHSTPSTLADWLEHIEGVHPKSIELGLDRVLEVKRRLGCSFAGTIITVGGTNGKGSTCAMLEAILLAAGYKVGLYTSPHLLAYNERVRVNGSPADDARLCEAFARVEAARDDVSLTYFEFGTLAAWVIFAELPLDVLILEVGLGGRLDAVNAFDADCAVITSVATDHTDYLGETREAIGAEKAGIFRTGRPAVIGDPEPPASLIEHARAIGADLQCLGRDFGYVAEQAQWTFWSRRARRAGLPHPALRGACQLHNASACLATLDALADRLPVGMNEVRRGLTTVAWPARFQVLPGRPAVVLDVAHNPEAAAALAQSLGDMEGYARTHAVVGMLRDKDIAGVCRVLKGQINAWYPASLGGARGADAETLAGAIRSVDAGAEIMSFDTPHLAFAAACRRAGENDRIVVFGSFYTVADVMAARASGPGS